MSEVLCATLFRLQVHLVKLEARLLPWASLFPLAALPAPPLGRKLAPLGGTCLPGLTLSQTAAFLMEMVENLASANPILGGGQSINTRQKGEGAGRDGSQGPTQSALGPGWTAYIWVVQTTVLGGSGPGDGPPGLFASPHPIP